MKNNSHSQDLPSILVVGATGQVGSQVVRRLASDGYTVRAMVRRPGSTVAEAPDTVQYVRGDLFDRASLDAAVAGIHTVVSTASAVATQTRGENAANVNDIGYGHLIAACEAAGVRRFVLSSVPDPEFGHTIPEIHGKRLIESRLAASSMQAIIVRNPAFMDVWLPMCGFGEAESDDPHATTKRNFGFLQFWLSLVRRATSKFGVFLAPGGAQAGAPLIATRDVAEMLAGVVRYAGTESLTVEAGGPQWLTWREVADTVGKHIGRKRVRVVPLPVWMARSLQALAKPISTPAHNVFGLIRLVGSYQPKWDSAPVVERLGLPVQVTIDEFLRKQLKAKSAPDVASHKAATIIAHAQSEAP